MSAHISIQNLSLAYELYLDKTNSLKEYVINTLTGRKWEEKKVDKFLALKDINIEIKNGERLGIVGLNGAGKSTLLKVISGILKPTSGKMEVVGNIQPLIEIGAGFNPEFSGRENIYFNGYMLGFTRREIQLKEKEIIEFSELEQFIDTPVKYYSSGMAVRLAFTIATMIQPEILLIDEMLGAGDAHFLSKAQKRMNDLMSTAKIIVIVSHDLEFIKKNSTRCILLEKGQIVLDGPTAGVVDEYYQRATAGT